MYNSHFGFREKPFKLVPNPDFLYLSKIHEIALAHLTYAVSQGDGFVVITGEVGTGKTTLCRIFLDRLDDSIESAYIFNPKLDSVQLMTTICNEFGIHTNVNNLKQLLDVINGYLIMKTKQGKRVLLLIDEAQNLSIENLEMVRMLSNLETTRNKLLQIILVGQPELGDKLDSYELRQLAQRISLSAHLTPLGTDETAGYIHHRVNIAAQRQANIFTKGACRQIYQYSNGIPRVINIACDRALLCAYSLNRPVVNAAIAKIAIKELSRHGARTILDNTMFYKRVALLGATLVGALVISGAVYSIIDKNRLLIAHPPSYESPVTINSSVEVPEYHGHEDSQVRTFKIHVAPEFEGDDIENRYSSDAYSDTSQLPVTLLETNPALKSLIVTLEHQTSRLNAVTCILKQWQQSPPTAAQLPVMVDDYDYFEIAAHQYGLRMYTVKSDLLTVKRLNLPAIVAIKTDSPGEVVYLTMIGWKSGQIQLRTDSEHNIIQTNLEALLPHMYGPAYIFWRNVINVEGVIDSSSSVRAVRAVKKLLLRAGYGHLEMTPVFDFQTQQAVIDFQLKHNLEPDGLVGPLTKIFLIKETESASFPILDAETGGAGA